MNAAMSKLHSKNAKISEFFFTTKIGNALLVSTVMLAVGIIPAILISMAP